MSEGPPRDTGHGGVFVLHETLDRLDAHHEVSHTDHGFTYLVDGWFRMEHGTEIRAEPGTVTVVPAGVPHRPIDGADMDYWLVGFCATCVGLDEGDRLMRPFNHVRRGALPVVSIPPDRRDRLLGHLRELEEETKRQGPDTPALARSLLLLALGDVCRAMDGQAPPTREGSLVSDALEFIQRHCLSPVSLKDVAAAVHRSPAHVASTVKKATGYSVGEWITAGRVAEAANRLAHTDDSLDTIAEHVGYQDKTHFIRQFRKQHGVTPAAWRKGHRHGSTHK